MDRLISIGGWIIKTFAPQYQVYWDALLALMKAAKALADEFGWSPSFALERASDIQFRRAEPDEEEREVLKSAGLQPADQNHDFAYTMN